MPKASPDMDDGAVEVVAERPMRRALNPVETAKVAQAPAGGRGRSLIGSSNKHNAEFILMRRQGQTAVRIPLPHVAVFRALWSLWSERRVNGAADPGVTVADLQAGLQMATSSVSSALRSLVKNGAVRSVDEHVGWRSRRVSYYPTDGGVEAFAIAEHLGMGSMVQVGKTISVWKDRSEGEPLNMFDHASLLSGGAAPADNDPVESV
jgi:DNA-binding MarR family transcriptional regulator